MERVVSLGAGVVLALATAPLAAQPRLFFEMDYGPGNRGFSPSHPYCDVRLFATFPSHHYAFAAARLDILSGEPWWSDNRVGPLVSLGSSPGIINGSTITDIIVGQIHFPPVLPANPSNPILLWQAVWSTSNFTLRDIQVETRTIRFDIYPSANSPVSESRLGNLREAHGVIVKQPPAPSSSVLLVLAGLALARRRR